MDDTTAKLIREITADGSELLFTRRTAFPGLAMEIHGQIGNQRAGTCRVLSEHVIADGRFEIIALELELLLREWKDFKEHEQRKNTPHDADRNMGSAGDNRPELHQAVPEGRRVQRDSNQ